MASGDPSMGSHDTVRTPSMSISRPSIATTTFALASFGWPPPEAGPELGDQPRIPLPSGDAKLNWTGSPGEKTRSWAGAGAPGSP